jgi:hypothetical protein
MTCGARDGSVRGEALVIEERASELYGSRISSDLIALIQRSDGEGGRPHDPCEGLWAECCSCSLCSFSVYDPILGAAA